MPALVRTANVGSFTREKLLKHGMSDSSTYQAWKDMKRRCLNRKASNYQEYGGRGITVCGRWLVFANFWEDLGTRPDKMTLERIDNNKSYVPGNVKWASREDQANNTRRNRYIDLDGRRFTISAWARERKVSWFLIRDRLDNGIDPRDAIMGVGR